MTSSLRLWAHDTFGRFGEKTWSRFDAESWSTDHAGLQAQCSGGSAVSAKVNEVAGLFFNSSEYLARSKSNRDFTGDVYNAYLRRGPGGDASGFNYWVGQVPVLGRDGVRAQFVPSAEFQSRVTAVVIAGCVQ